jgi:hypothetical protein
MALGPCFTDRPSCHFGRSRFFLVTDAIQSQFNMADSRGRSHRLIEQAIMVKLKDTICVNTAQPIFADDSAMSEKYVKQ